MYYKINLSNKANKDINRITEYLQKFSNSTDKIIKRISKDIENLLFMPRIHKTLICSQDKTGEHRRIVSGKYVIIYKIVKDEIIVLRIFNQKENYLNSKHFILKEESQRYKVNRRREKIMLKLRVIKNSYLKLKENFAHTITEEEIEERYLSKILDETIENIKNEGVFYTEEEFWKIVEEMEIEEYGEPISYKIRKKYA